MLPNAFYVEDILLLILDHIAYRHDVYTWKIDCKISHLKEGAKERLQVLASLARVCRFISGFALDRLWWPLFDLKQLCRVLPNVKETRFKDGAGKDCVRMSLDGPVDERAWQRLLSYGRRVNHTYFGRDGIDQEMFAEFIRLSGGQTIIPNAQKVYWQEEAYVHQELLLFINPSMIGFGIEHRSEMWAKYELDTRPQSKQDEISMMQTLVDRAPNLAEFYLDTIIICGEAAALASQLTNMKLLEFVRLNHNASATLEALPGFGNVFAPAQRLQGWEHFSVSESMFWEITKMRKLKKLILNVDGITFADGKRPFFPSLEMARLYGESESKCRFLKSIDAPRLARVLLMEEARYAHHESWVAFAPCFEILVDRYRANLTLVEFIRNTQDNFGPTISIMTIISPVLLAPNITSFTVKTGDKINLTDFELKSMLLAWPLLHTLDISNIEGDVKPTPASLETIITLAPQLRYLKLEVDFSTCPRALTMITRSHLKMYSLVIWMADSEHIKFPQVAEHVARLFPNLDIAQSLLSVAFDNNRRWELVLEAMKGGVAREGNMRVVEGVVIEEVGGLFDLGGGGGQLDDLLGIQADGGGNDDGVMNATAFEW